MSRSCAHADAQHGRMVAVDMPQVLRVQSRCQLSCGKHLRALRRRSRSAQQQSLPPAVLRRPAAAAAALAAHQRRPPPAARMPAALLPLWRRQPEPRRSAGSGGCFCCLLLPLTRVLLLRLLSIHLPLGGSRRRWRSALPGWLSQSCQQRPHQQPYRFGEPLLLLLLLLLTLHCHLHVLPDPRTAALPRLRRAP